MKTVIKSCFIILLLLNLSLITFSQLAGKTFITSNCASCGFDYYFFDSNEVISECFGCEVIPYFQYGTYKTADPTECCYYVGRMVYKGEKGKVLSASSINHYGRYVTRFFQSMKI